MSYLINSLVINLFPMHPFSENYNLHCCCTAEVTLGDKMVWPFFGHATSTGEALNNLILKHAAH